MKSEFDELQEWPFYNEATLRLLNLDDLEKSISGSFIPDPESPSFMKPRIDINIASGCPRLLQKSKLFNNGFIKNDCIYILKGWLVVVEMPTFSVWTRVWTRPRMDPAVIGRHRQSV